MILLQHLTVFPFPDQVTQNTYEAHVDNNKSSDLDDSDNESDEGEPDIEDVHLIEAPLSWMVTEMSAPNGGRILNAISLPTHPSVEFQNYRLTVSISAHVP